MFRSGLIRIWLGFLGVLAWVAVLLDNTTTSFCLVIPCCGSRSILYEANPITAFFMDIFGLDWVLWANSGLSLLVILWIYERVMGTMSNRATWMASLTFVFLILIRGQAALNNWSIYTRFFIGET